MLGGIEISFLEHDIDVFCIDYPALQLFLFLFFLDLNIGDVDFFLLQLAGLHLFGILCFGFVFLIA